MKYRKELQKNYLFFVFKVLEKHITLDKTMKGTDHVCSLTPVEFKQLVKDVRVIEASLGTPIKKVVTSGTYILHAYNLYYLY